VLFDTNVILDVLQDRKPWSANAKELMLMVADEKLSGFLTAKELCDIWYLAKQIHTGEENAHKKSQVYISRLYEIFGILDTTAEDIITALSFGCSDFEDGVMIATAEREHMDGIVTRNGEDYKTDVSIKVWTEQELVDYLNGCK